MTSIFVVDPGVATGWVEWRDHIIDSGELGQRDFLLLAERYIYDCVVVCESFKVMQSTLKKTFQPASLEITDEVVAATGVAPDTPKFLKVKEQMILSRLDARPKKPAPEPEPPPPPPMSSFARGPGVRHPR